MIKGYAYSLASVEGLIEKAREQGFNIEKPYSTITQSGLDNDLGKIVDKKTLIVFTDRRDKRNEESISKLHKLANEFKIKK